MTARDWRAASNGILVFLFVFLAAREIDRPFDGLHSWDAAIAAWPARSHLDYGLGYTRGVATLAVGNPPPAVPPWYLDHPQLHVLLDAGAMAIFGRNEVALRLAALIVTAASLPFLIVLLRRLYDEETAVLATFLYIVFPITPYFNAACWTYWLLPFVLLAYWCYLILIGELRDGPPPGRRHFLGLGLAFFVLPQLEWVGFFYVAAIGSHYLLRCFEKHQRPDRRLLATLVLSPLASAVVVFGVLLYGRSGGFQGLLGLYEFRAQMANGSGRTSIGWFVKQWEMVQSNFTLPVVLIIGAYLAYRVVARIRARRAGVESTDQPAKPSRAFVHPWILVMPGILTMVVFTEWFWVHQFVYKWLTLPVAVAAALGILKMRDSLLTRGRAVANGATFVVVAVICGYAVRGTDDYYAIRHRSPVEIDMFKKLNREIAPDETLLTYQSYVAVENPNKLAHLRPEVAWYLDRAMVVATTMEQVEQKAAKGKFPFYLVEVDLAPPALVEQLKARYPSEFVQGQPYRDKPHVVAGIGDQLIFDLRQGDLASMTRGLEALYRAHDPGEAATYFRKVLARNPDHYGANYQLARVLDLLGSSEEAERYWKRTLELAGRFADTATAGIATRRLMKGR